MTDYTKLVEALRCCAGTNTKPTKCPDYGDFWCDGKCLDKHLIAAADAIEALQAELPKLGEWIKHPEVKNIYGGVYIECPFCGEKYVVQYVSDEKFCRNCGANLRAKTEVQDDKA